jgi:hypothetical protein
MRSRALTHPQSLARTLLHTVLKLRLFWFIFIAIFLLSGCVRADVGIRFEDANHGEIVQHIRLRSQASLDQAIATAWISDLAQRTQVLGGNMQHPTPEEWRLRIPFYNANDLESKFNQLLQPELAPSKSAKSALPVSHLRIKTLNRLLWQRNELQYDLDLRSLRSLLQTNFSDSFDLEFKLQTPWGARVPTANGQFSPLLRKSGWQLVWKLKPGVMNHIEAVFLLPSPIGIGFVAIALLVIFGMVSRVLSRSALEVADPSTGQKVRT